LCNAEDAKFLAAFSTDVDHVNLLENAFVNGPQFEDAKLSCYSCKKHAAENFLTYQRAGSWTRKEFLPKIRKLFEENDDKSSSD